MNPLCLENCNVTRELDIVGESIADFFPPLLADVFIARDREAAPSSTTSPTAPPRCGP